MLQKPWNAVCLSVPIDHGIDIYQAKWIRRLSGAVADASAVRAHLVDHLRVPENHITFLTNQSASRAAIIKGLQGLAVNPSIQPGDPILIYYAGHGSQTNAPDGWNTEGHDRRIQLTLAYDSYHKSEGKEIQPIADRTLGLLINNIVKEKGDNILVIMDSCHSASATRSTEHASECVRTTPVPPKFKLQETLRQNESSSYLTSGSHVLLSACSSSGQAWECNGRGVFTVALLDLLSDSSNSKLSYSNIIKRLKIDARYRQSPHCEGPNQDRAIFTSTSPPSPPETFAAHRVRFQVGQQEEYEYVINGGTAHGLAAGDVLSIYPDEDATKSDGTLIVATAFPYSSIMRLPQDATAISLGGNAVARPVRQSKFPLLRVFCSSNPTPNILSSLQNLPFVTVVGSHEDAQVKLSFRQDGRMDLQLLDAVNFDACSLIQRTCDIEDLLQVLKSLWNFVGELCHTANDPSLAQHTVVELHELKDSRRRFPDAPVTELIPCRTLPLHSGPIELEQDVFYGISIVNNSKYDLYPIVQLFRANDTFDISPLYRSPFSMSGLDVPLPVGGTLTLGYGSGGSAPLFFSPSDRHLLSVLKVSLFTRPLDPLYDVQSFRSAKTLPKSYAAPWATVTKAIVSLPPAGQRDATCSQGPISEYSINRPSQFSEKSNASRKLKPYSQAKGIFSDQRPETQMQLRRSSKWGRRLAKIIKTVAGSRRS